MSKFKRLPIVFAVAFLLLGPGVSQAEKKIEWTFTSSLMNTHPVNANAVIPMFERIKQESGNRFEITVYNPGSIVPIPEMYSALKRGVVDMICDQTARHPNEFPSLTLGDYPFLFRSSRAASFSMAELYKNNSEVRKDLAGARLFSFTSSTPFDIVSTKPISKMEDFKGMRFGVIESASVKLIEMLGGVPILLALSDLYISLQRNLVDAIVAPIPAYRSLKVCEVGKYIIKCNLKCGVSPLIINQNSFNKLPADIKAVFDRYSVGVNTTLQSNWVEISREEDFQWLIKNSGVKVIKIAPEEIARWEATVSPIYDTWIASAKKKGVKNPEAILAELRTYAAKYNDEKAQIAEGAKHKEILGDMYMNLGEK